MGCWRVKTRYGFGELLADFYFCAEEVTAEFTGDNRYPDSCYLFIDGKRFGAGFAYYFVTSETSISVYTPTAAEIAEGKCSACPCPPGHCNIKCDRAANGYCCLSHNFINSLIEQLQ